MVCVLHCFPWSYETLTGDSFHSVFPLSRVTPDLETMGTNLLLIPLKFSVGIHLWYLYVLMGLYLFLPVISPWVEKAGKAAFAYFLLLWALTLLFPYLQTISPAIWENAPGMNTGPCIPSPGTWATWCSAAF